MPLLFEKNIETEREIEDVGLNPTKKRGVKERKRDKRRKIKCHFSPF